jgi:multiple RNA-binding domain-containing protein 1
MMAPNRAIAIAEFQSPEFADNALKSLQDHKFKNSILFLEFAPVGMLDEQAIEKKLKTLKKEEEEAEELSKVVYIKNLNFESDESQLF